MVQSDKKILFVGPLKTASSWGIACREYLTALSLVYPNITVNDFYMGGGRTENIPQKLADLQYKRFDDYDTCIQMCLPHYFYGDKRFRKNIGITFIETIISNAHDPRIKNAQLLDHLVVASNFSVNTLSKLTKVSEIPIPIDPTIGYKKYNDLSKSFRDNDKTFVFYTIADYSQRKNLDQLIRAFLTEFNPWDNVSLVIKTNVDLKPLLDQIKSEIGTRDKNCYKEIRLIEGNLSREDLLSIHYNGDCYVNVSHGEGFCIPAYEALAFDNYVLYPNYINSFFSCKLNAGIKVIQTHLDKCVCSDAPLPDYYNANDEWYYFDTQDIARALRNISRPFTRKLKTKSADLSSVSYKAVASQFHNIIE